MLFGSLAVVLLVAGSVGVAIGGVTASATTPAADSATGADDLGDANETVPHVNPDEYDEDGDLSDVRLWVAQQLADRLHDSTAALERGSYDAAVAHLEGGYEDRYDEYELIVRETGGYHHDELAGELPEAYSNAREETLALVESLEAYDERTEEYDRALERGDEAAAFELALELDVLADDVADANDRLQHQFTVVEVVAGADLRDSPDVVSALHEAVQSERATIRDEQFAETAITAAADDAVATPSDPVTLTGSIDAPDDSWPNDRETVTVEVNDEPHALPVVDDPEAAGTGIGSDGEFVLEYRPNPLASTTDELRLEYVPEPGIGHRSTETTVPVAIDSIEPTLSIDAPADAAYGDIVLVTGELAAGDVTVEAVSLTVTLGTEELGTVVTTEGSFEEPMQIPASVADGERELVASLDVEDRALEPVSTRAPVRITERESQLTLSVTERTAGEIHAVGTLAAGGDGVGEQPIHLAVDGEHVGTVTTGPDGSFEETITLSTTGPDPTVTATYEGEGTNVAATQERTTVETTAQDSWLGDWTIAGYVFAGSIVLGGVLVGLWRLVRYYRSRRVDDGFAAVFGDRSTGSSSSGSVASNDTTFTASGTPGPDRRPSDAELPVSIGPSHSHELLKQASTQLSSGRTNEAIQSAYVAARMELQSFVADGTTLTHWEFHERYSGPHADALGEITEQYERAAFGLEQVSQEEASEVVVSARLLVEGMSDSGMDDGLDGIVVEE